MRAFAKSMKRYFSMREVIIGLIAVIISITAGVGAFLYIKKDVVIIDEGKALTVKTMKSTVEEVLEQNGIALKPEDYINIPLNSTLKNNTLNEIRIERAVPISVFADGREYKIMTYKDTVAEALDDSPVRLLASDRLEGVDMDDPVVEGMSINVVRIREDIVSENIPIPFEVLSRENKSMDKGKERIVKEGKEGVLEKRYKVVIENGKEVSRELVEERVAMEPVNQIVEYGTVLNFKSSRGDVVRYKKVVDMKATAYTASYKHTGKNPGDKHYGITYSGLKAKKGVVAVDPKVIPLGTRLYIEGVGNTPDYGYAVAADIGSAVKGNRIDLYFDDEKTVDKWGIKNVKVYILLD